MSSTSISPRKQDLFIHKPLSSTKDSFRLCRILFDEPSENNHGSLATAVSSEPAIRLVVEHFEIPVYMESSSYSEERPEKLTAATPEYTALSYTWGAESPQFVIMTNNQLFTIRQNLMDFLLEISRQKEARWFWIDQICINQSNILERNHQVSQMARIYSGARQVYAWLGVDSDNSATALRVLSSPHKFASDVEIDLEAAKAILMLCMRPYWRRVWICQELLLARQVILLCGPSSCDTYMRFYIERVQRVRELVEPSSLRSLDEETMRWRVENGLPDEVLSSGCCSYVACLLNMGYFHYDYNNHLYRWALINKLKIMEFDRLGCAEPRDHVYGYMAIAGPNFRCAVDYPKAIEDVFRDWADKYVTSMDWKTPEAAVPYLTQLRTKMGLVEWSEDTCGQFIRSALGRSLPKVDETP